MPRVARYVAAVRSLSLQIIATGQDRGVRGGAHRRTEGGVHIVYVDMSAKAEQWTQNSAVAMANDVIWVCMVPGKVKQRVRKLLAQRHGAKNLQYRVFTAMVYMALQGRLSTIQQIVIDKDYHGAQAEATIKNLLLVHIRKELPGAEAGLIRFANVKGSEADLLARRVFDGKTAPDRVVRYRELERLFTA